MVKIDGETPPTFQVLGNGSGNGRKLQSKIKDFGGPFLLGTAGLPGVSVTPLLAKIDSKP